MLARHLEPWVWSITVGSASKQDRTNPSQQGEHNDFVDVPAWTFKWEKHKLFFV